MTIAMTTRITALPVPLESPHRSVFWIDHVPDIFEPAFRQHALGRTRIGECMRQNESNIRTREGIVNERGRRFGGVPVAPMVGLGAVRDFHFPVPPRALESAFPDDCTRAAMLGDEAMYPGISS
jgi:hypothetical protein